MAGIEGALEAVLAYAADDSHGYVFGASGYGAGTDCSGLVQYYAAKIEGVEPTSYPNLNTRNMRSIMTGRGWEATEFTGTSALKRGDVLLTNTKSHTVIWLGGGRIVGAEGDWDGKRGDGSGTEVTERSYYAYSWQWVLRWPGGGIEEDGLWGEDTTLATQGVLGMRYKDGEVSRQDASLKARMPGCTTGWEWLDEPGSGSPLIRELQRIWGAEQTGVMDVDTINAMIGYYMKKGSGATKRDGKLDRNSKTIKQFQHEVNNGRV